MRLKIDNKAQFLGLVFDSKLNWRERITYLEEKCFLLHTSLGFRSGNWRNVTRLKAEIKYAIKVKATESHPAKSVTEFH